MELSLIGSSVVIIMDFRPVQGKAYCMPSQLWQLIEEDKSRLKKLLEKFWNIVIDINTKLHLRYNLFYC